MSDLVAQPKAALSRAKDSMNVKRTAATAAPSSSSSSSTSSALLRFTFEPSSFYPPPSSKPRPGRLGNPLSLFDNGVRAFTRMREGRPSPWTRIPSHPSTYELSTYQTDHPSVSDKKTWRGTWDEAALGELVETQIITAYTTALASNTINPNFYGNPDYDDENMSDLDRAMAGLAVVPPDSDSDSSAPDHDDYDSSDSEANTDDDDDEGSQFGDNVKATLEMKDENSLLFTLSNVSFRLPHTEFAIEIADSTSANPLSRKDAKQRFKAQKKRQSKNDFFRLPWDLRAKIMAEARRQGFESRIEPDEAPVQDSGVMDVLVSGLTISILFSFHSHPASELSTVLANIIHAANPPKASEEEQEVSAANSTSTASPFDSSNLRNVQSAASDAAKAFKAVTSAAASILFKKNQGDDSASDDSFSSSSSSSSFSADSMSDLATFGIRGEGGYQGNDGDEEEDLQKVLSSVHNMLEYLGISEIDNDMSSYNHYGGIPSSASVPFIFANDPGAAAARLTSFQAQILDCTIDRVDLRFLSGTGHEIRPGLSPFTIAPSPAHPISFWPYYASDFLPSFHVAVERAIRKHLALPVTLLTHFLSVFSVKHHCRAVELIAKSHE